MPQSLRQLRQVALLTQAELAARLGIAYQRVGAWERAESVPRPANQRRLAEALAVSPSDLLAAVQESRARAARRRAGAQRRAERERKPRPRPIVPEVPSW